MAEQFGAFGGPRNLNDIKRCNGHLRADDFSCPRMTHNSSDFFELERVLMMMNGMQLIIY